MRWEGQEDSERVSDMGYRGRDVMAGRKSVYVEVEMGRESRGYSVLFSRPLLS
jgi:hypothetical protein